MKILILLSMLVSSTVFGSDDTDNGHSIIYQEDVVVNDKPLN